MSVLHRMKPQELPSAPHLQTISLLGHIHIPKAYRHLRYILRR